jgi:hypothetical protein
MSPSLQTWTNSQYKEKQYEEKRCLANSRAQIGGGPRGLSGFGTLFAFVENRWQQNTT